MRKQKNKVLACMCSFCILASVVAVFRAVAVDSDIDVLTAKQASMLYESGVTEGQIIGTTTAWNEYDTPI